MLSVVAKHPETIVVPVDFAIFRISVHWKLVRVDLLVERLKRVVSSIKCVMGRSEAEMKRREGSWPLQSQGQVFQVSTGQGAVRILNSDIQQL